MFLLLMERCGLIEAKRWCEQLGLAYSFSDVVIAFLHGPQRKQFRDTPNVICYASFHCRRYPERLMHAAEIVVSEMQGNSRFQM